MAIVRDTSDGASTSAASSITQSVTVASGKHRRLVVAVANNDNANAGPVEPTGVTYAGVALTKQVAQGATVSGDNQVSIWELVNPPIGTANLIASFAGLQDFIDIGWVVLQGASQDIKKHATTPQSSPNTQNPALSATAAISGVWAVSVGYPKDSPATGTITNATEFGGAFFSDMGYSGPHNAGTVTHTYGGAAGTEDWILCIILIAPQNTHLGALGAS